MEASLYWMSQQPWKTLFSPNHQTLEQFNQQFQQLANKVQTTMRKTPKDFDISRCDRPEIVKLVEEAQDLLNCLKNAGLRPDRDAYRWLDIPFCQGRTSRQGRTVGP